jgi:hypothetical protein
MHAAGMLMLSRRHGREPRAAAAQCSARLCAGTGKGVRDNPKGGRERDITSEDRLRPVQPKTRRAALGHTADIRDSQAAIAAALRRSKPGGVVRARTVEKQDAERGGRWATIGSGWPSISQAPPFDPVKKCRRM